MNNYFSFKGTSSLTYGVTAMDLGPESIPEERVTFEKALGRSGDIAFLEGNEVYNDITRSIECHCADISRIAEIGAWLRGSGNLILPTRPGGHYVARVVNQIDLEKIIRARPNRSFTVNFRCRPFFYLDNVSDRTITTSGTSINNTGTVHSEPRIKITGSGDFFVSIGDQMMTFTDISTGIIVDTELQDALSYNGSQLQNEKVSGDFFEIPVGTSLVSWGAIDENDNPGSVTKIVITPRWRTF